MASENIIMAMVKAGGNRQVRACYQGNVPEDARPELHWTPLPSVGAGPHFLSVGAGKSTLLSLSESVQR